jgi:pimeloyl-ACP methyl ester carboxylesterase
VAAETYLCFLVIGFGLHLYFDGMRWEMIPTYLLGIWGAVMGWRDFRRHGGSIVAPVVRHRLIVGAVVTVTGIIAVAIPQWLFPRVEFARPSGYYPVGRIEAFWVDSTREEVFAKAPGGKRSLLLTIWYPADTVTRGTLSPYHPNPSVLAKDELAGTGLPGFTMWNVTRAKTHSTLNAPFNRREGRSPVLLFSPGYGGSRVQNSFEFEELASYGYVIVSIEHSYASAGTVFPDGQHIPNTTKDMMRSDSGATRLLNTWVADAEFVLNRLEKLPVGDVTDTVARRLQLDKVGYFGHSFGGAAAAEAMSRDPRIKAGIDMDGMPYGTSWKKGIDAPFLVFRSHPPDFASMSEAQLKAMGVSLDSLRTLYKGFGIRVDSLLRFGGTEIRMDGILHTGFSDKARWSPPLGRRFHLVGTDNPERAQFAITSYTLAFFSKYLKNTAKEYLSVEIPPGVQIKVVPHKPTGVAPAR